MHRRNICDICGHRMTKVGEDEYFCQYCHDHHLNPLDDYDDGEDDYDGESLSVEDAALIWLSHGGDEDYNFGFSDDELRDALE